jgi:hypothetical protein
VYIHQQQQDTIQTNLSTLCKQLMLIKQWSEGWPYSSCCCLPDPCCCLCRLKAAGMQLMLMAVVLGGCSLYTRYHVGSLQRADFTQQEYFEDSKQGVNNCHAGCEGGRVKQQPRQAGGRGGLERG